MHDWRADVRARMATLGLAPGDEHEMVEELAQHLEAQFAELASRIGAAAAREQLLAELGDRGLDAAAMVRRRVAPPTRARVWHASSLARDLAYGVRSLRRSPGLVAAGVAALALGIGLTTVMFSVIYGLLIKGLPFDDADRIAIIYRADQSGRGREDLVPLADFVRYRSAQRSFTAFGGFYQGPVNLSGGDRPERVDVARVTAGVFEATGVRPILGRAFTAADNAPDAPPAAVLGYAVWRDRFGSDSSVLNKTIHVNGRPYAILGVMPEGYQFPQSQKLWLPVQLDPDGLLPGQGTGLTIVGHLRAGVSYANANAELSELARRLARENADTAAVRDLVQPFVRANIPGRVYALLYAMLGAVFLVLLVACANVANLLLDRAANRAREIGIRVALGASRTAIVRQSLVESCLLALLAAIIGTGLAQVGIVTFNRAMIAIEADRPFWTDIRLHPLVLLFVLGAAALASIASGLLPAIHAARLDINTILKDESHAASSMRVGRLSRTIVVGEIALSSAMLLAAGFMTKSIAQLRSLQPRFTSANVFTARVSLATGDTLQQRRFFTALEHDLSSTPGLGGVYLGSDVPGTGWRGGRITIEGRSYARPQDHPFTRWLAVSPGFFETFGVTVLRGRAIQPADRAGSEQVAVVSEAFARRNFGNADAIGKRIAIGDAPAKDWMTIVGVVPNLYAANPVTASDNHFPAEVLTAFWQQHGLGSASVALRGPSATANATTLRAAVLALDPDVPVYGALSMDDVLQKPTWPVRVFGTMFVIFGIASLVLAAIGLYAVMAFSVSRRVREMGIRMALGATSAHVIRMICWQGTRQLLIGMSLGLLIGGSFVNLVRMLLFEVQPSDPTVFALVVGVLGGTAFLASILPAVRATRVDPLVALRSE